MGMIFGRVVGLGLLFKVYYEMGRFVFWLMVL